MGTGRARLLDHYLRYLLKRCSVPMRVRVRHGRLRPIDPHQVIGNPDRLMRLGWRPKKTAFDALEDLLRQSRQKIKRAGASRG